ncbi:MAG: hypothetical protein FJ137_20215 [Deltaproteobacteria bacterium]|nr:hypothetical protein [Deltaproteobacteria bacterium]
MGTWLVAQSILDETDALIATAVTGAFGGMWIVGTLIFGVDGLDNALGGPAFPVLAFATIGGTLANIVTPAVLVALDPPTE